MTRPRPPGTRRRPAGGRPSLAGRGRTGDVGHGGVAGATKPPTGDTLRFPVSASVSPQTDAAGEAAGSPSPPPPRSLRGPPPVSDSALSPPSVRPFQGVPGVRLQRRGPWAPTAGDKATSLAPPCWLCATLGRTGRWPRQPIFVGLNSVPVPVGRLDNAPQREKAPGTENPALGWVHPRQRRRKRQVEMGRLPAEAPRAARAVGLRASAQLDKAKGSRVLGAGRGSLRTHAGPSGCSGKLGLRKCSPAPQFLLLLRGVSR